jgi:LmbE family N-acetylglucosaminyl deacetylase
MRTIILSPHLDDGAYSCGGWIWEQVRKGQEVIVCTLFAGSPTGITIPPFAELLQQTWGFQGDATTGRRQEDAAACAFLGCEWRHLEFLDCIYRIFPISVSACPKSG